MKKLIACFMLALVAFMLFSCNSVNPTTEKVSILDKVSKVTFVDNPELAGSIFAKGIYTSYLMLKKDGKHEKEVKILEDLYLQLLQAETADEKPKLAAVNRAGLTVLRAALIAKYGVIGDLIADAVEIGGDILDARIKKRLAGADEEKFMTALISTLKECVANTPAIEKEIEEECINCDIVERIKRELARDDLTDEERAEYEKMLKQYESSDGVGFCGQPVE